MYRGHMRHSEWAQGYCESVYDDLHGAYANANDNTLHKDVLVVLHQNAHYHCAEDEDEGPGDHDWAWVIHIKYLTDGASLLFFLFGSDWCIVSLFRTYMRSRSVARAGGAVLCR